MVGLGASEVINHAAPTFCIQVPIFEATDAIHRERKSGSRNGLHADARVCSTVDIEKMLVQKSPAGSLVFWFRVSAPVCHLNSKRGTRNRYGLANSNINAGQL